MVFLPGYDVVYIKKIVQLSDGGYIALGNQDGNSGTFALSVIRLDSLGNLIWNQPFFSSGGDDYIEALEVTSDGSFLVGTHSSGGISPWKSDSLIGYEDVWLLKFDSVGNFLWDNSYGSTNTDQIFDICLSTSGDIYLIGRSNSTIGFDKTERSWGDFDYWALKVSNNGIKLWDKTIGGKGIDTGYRIKLLPNGDILIGGESWSPSGCDRRNFIRGIEDLWLMSLTENYNEITGNVFTDMNSNSIQDSGDFIPQNLKIQTNDSNYFSFISYDGTYKMLVEDNTYNFLPDSNPYYGVNPALNTATFTGFKQIDSLNNFILHPYVFIQDLKITLAPPALVRPGFNASYMISCENKGTVPVPAQIYFKLYPNTSYISSTATPILQTSDSVLWDIGIVNPGQNKIISVTIKLDTIIQVGDILNSYAQALPIATDFAPSDNNATWESIVRGSMDPNDILVDKRTIEYSTLPSNPTLRYTIRFQNTGNAPATIVNIINNLPIKLLDATFELEASSHPVNIEYTKNSRMLKFDFPGILLPDSGTNNEQSMGFVQYSIRPLTNLVPGDSIRNKALIYFDYNSPVITNYAITAIVQTTSVEEVVANGKLNVYPNPATNVLNISLPESVQPGIVMVYDLQGRLIWQEKVNQVNEMYRMSLQAVDPGMYTIQFISGNNRYSSRFVRL
ncbi:MAG: T9SS type A sorting domain-containing protein [Bacteroidetes bacterium]|nr:T9SS type A sorting domain-containing protein [Bacteroidota bacterium]